MQIKWHKLNDKAIIPTKREEDAGFDIYTIEDDVLLNPGEKRLFSTGLAAAPEKGWWLLAYDRGSTGSKGIHTHCGVVDNGYRGEIFICLCNDNPMTPVLFTSKVFFTKSDDFCCAKIWRICTRAALFCIPKCVAWKNGFIMIEYSQ